MSQSPETTSSPTEPTVDLKNPMLAAGLALLVPGLGHAYQGRNFKAAIFFVCILGLFFTGQALGDWKVVYLSDGNSAGRLAVGTRGQIFSRLLSNYAAQFPVGVVAWPAMLQSSRYNNPANSDRVHLDAPMRNAPFEGGIWIDTADGRPYPLATLVGVVSLEPRGNIVSGEFSGLAEEQQQQITLELERVIELGRPISASDFRTLGSSIAALPDSIAIPQDITVAPDAEPFFKGGIRRPFWDKYQVPLGEQGEDELTRRLGALAEIAWVFTWIAGLLNVLAIWDAADGPAYGYGTSTEPDPQNDKKTASKTSEAKTQTAAASAPPPASSHKPPETAPIPKK